jgi:mevalonate kinase
VEALSRGDLPAVGALLDASHASLRDLYEISTPELDAAVELLHAGGAAGARLMGGGFGGSVLGLLPPDAARAGGRDGGAARGGRAGAGAVGGGRRGRCWRAGCARCGAR